jgi:hypothetical protein
MRTFIRSRLVGGGVLIVRAVEVVWSLSWIGCPTFHQSLV